MRGLVAPLHKVAQIGHFRRVCDVQIQRKAEAIEVSFQVGVAWISTFQRQVGEKLHLCRGLQAGGNMPHASLRAFAIQVATEALKMRAEMQDEIAQGFVREIQIRRRHGNDGRAVRFNFTQAEHAIVLPLKKRGRRHQETSRRMTTRSTYNSSYMKTASLTPKTEAEIWLRILYPDDELSPPVAEAILELSFPEEEVRRMHELSAKARAGTLTPEEDMMMDNYERAGSILSTLKSRARQVLKRSGQHT